MLFHRLHCGAAQMETTWKLSSNNLRKSTKKHLSQHHPFSIPLTLPPLMPTQKTHIIEMYMRMIEHKAKSAIPGVHKKRLTSLWDPS